MRIEDSASLHGQTVGMGREQRALVIGPHGTGSGGKGGGREREDSSKKV